jgi:hypothetical protein
LTAPPEPAAPEDAAADVEEEVATGALEVELELELELDPQAASVRARMGRTSKGRRFMCRSLDD